ncbi:histidine phosphatase family protein [Antarcticimicrobium luteum]|uniref:Histidine phosphatase family protein n=1 Tax=Antarcticimicrobium luteum TaxID=2547397 RepID=A0A4R5UTC6_9RHOB|nr:histidine phosphatase family protein [Antarcticimicrobium luteum]TDK42246.1 histidine phosphatase family protein [Antarcticimicrobium luteum]
MTRLHLVRHGPTHARGMVGWSDLPADLSDTAALSRLSAHLPERAVVVSSDLSRAAATADAIQGARRRLPHRRALREINFGSWELRSFRDIEAEDPGRARAYWDTPGETRPPGGESWHQVRARVDAAIDALIAEHVGGDLIVVAHFGVIVTQIQRALALDSTQAFGHRIDNLSVTEIGRDGTVWNVGRINHIP